MGRIEIFHSWNGLSCAVCARGQTNRQGVIDGCDLDVEGARDEGYCCLFVAHEGKVKTKREMSYMFEQHVQRWIREKLCA